MSTTISKKPDNIPALPGVYLFKNSQNAIIYIGKAKSLAQRVSSYFHASDKDWKITALLSEYATIEYIVTHSETEARLLEAQLIRDNNPKYNVLLKHGNPFIYILVTSEELPQLKLVRVQKEKGRYLGPFLQKNSIRKAYNYLIRAFSLELCTKKITEGCLDYHLQKCAGSCRPDFDCKAYLERLKNAIKVLDGSYETLFKDLHSVVTFHTTQLAFEKARHVYECIIHFDALVRELKANFTHNKYDHDVIRAMSQSALKQHVPSEAAAHELQKILNLSYMPIVIDCFDISHFQSQALVGSCVRFINGIPAYNKFRKFKIKSLTQQNDYAALYEIVKRRYARGDLPDLVVIDGGKGQLNAVRDLLPTTPCLSIAKREETIFSYCLPKEVKLDVHTPMGKLLIALRDYTHHFAIRYHQHLRRQHILQKTV